MSGVKTVSVRREPRKLVRLAKEQGVPPQEIVVQAIANTTSLREAAESLGVTAPTLRAWRRLYRVRVRSTIL